MIQFWCAGRNRAEQSGSNEEGWKLEVVASDSTIYIQRQHPNALCTVIPNLCYRTLIFYSTTATKIVTPVAIALILTSTYHLTIRLPNLLTTPHHVQRIQSPMSECCSPTSTSGKSQMCGGWWRRGQLWPEETCKQKRGSMTRFGIANVTIKLQIVIGESGMFLWLNLIMSG